VSVNDPTYGPVADFTSNAVDLTIENIPTLVGNSSRTYSVWVNPDNVAKNSTIVSISDTSNWRWISGHFSNRFYEHINGDSSTYDQNLNNTTRTNGTWYHMVFTRDNTNSIHNHYVNGAISFTYTGTLAGTTFSDLTFGKIKSIAATNFDGQMLDIKIYDGVITPAEITDLYNMGPNPINVWVIPRSITAIADITPVSGATAYRITSQIGSGDEKIEKTDFTDLTQIITNLTPETEYIFRSYSTTGSTYTLIETITISTLENLSSNYVTTDFINEDGDFDITSLNSDSINLLNGVINNLLSTGDIVDVNVDGGKRTSKFIKIGENLSVDSTDTYLMPFLPTSGSGQSVSITLTDTSTVNVSYDETTEVLTVGTDPHILGESFILDGMKAFFKNV